MDQQFTEEAFINFIRMELAKQYYRYPAVRSMFELDDIVYDVVLWYYQPMKNGEQRLAHYLKAGNMNHFWNTLKYGLQQTIPALLRYNYMKNIPLSLNAPLDQFEEETGEFLDTVKDETESIESKVQFDDTLQKIFEALKEANKQKLFKEEKKNNPNLTKIEFSLDTSNIIYLGYVLEDQKNIILDLVRGFSKKELREKYEFFDNNITFIKSIIKAYYESQGTPVEVVLGVRSK